MTTHLSNWSQLFEALHDTQIRISLVVTGGGTGAVERCFRRAGASRNFVDAVIPYSRAAVTDYLGCPPSDSSASGPVARQLASVAFSRASRLDDDGSSAGEAVGIGLVAALPTAPPRRGQDRINVVLHKRRQVVWWSLSLTKDAHTRESAETIADEMVLCALAELVGDVTNDRFFRDAELNLKRVDFNL